MVYHWLKDNHKCLLCDEPAEQPLSLCGNCETDLPWLAGQCAVCALPLPTQGLACGACLRQPPAFSRVEAPWHYTFPVDTLITRFKHQARWPLGRLLAELLARHLHHAFAEGLPRPQRLVPVPLAHSRQRQRGFNQADMLSHWLSRELQLPVDQHLLLRTRDTPAQQGLDARARQRNLRQAFALAAHATVENQHLALIDDVLTTGATAHALAQLLRQAGATRVDVYCLARTPKPGD